jgi:hypothetical protein
VCKDGDAQVIASKGRSKWYVRDGLHPDAGGTPVRTQQYVGLSLRSQTSKREMPIGPMGDVKGAENNLGLDDIPQGLGGGMDRCWL